jgi:hypothetical protein
MVIKLVEIAERERQFGSHAAQGVSDEQQLAGGAKSGGCDAKGAASWLGAGDRGQAGGKKIWGRKIGSRRSLIFLL